MYVTAISLPMFNYIDRALTVNEARDNIKRIREAALHERAEIHFGERGRDEVVILSATALAELKERAREAATAAPRSRRDRAGTSKQSRFVAEVLAGDLAEGPSDLAQSVDEYLY